MPEADLTPFLAISRISDPSSSLEGMIDLWVHGKSLHTQRYYRREAQKFLAMVAKPLELVLHHGDFDRQAILSFRPKSESLTVKISMAQY